MDENDILNNPALKNIDKKKLDALLKLTSQAGSKSNDELLPFFLSTFSGNNNLDFDDEETNAILEVMKTRMSPKEIKKIDTIRNLSRIIAAKSKQKGGKK
ncbi:MAG: hypothetical protein E7265_05590 [Lachnospiraceae bacterium]|nr:hypothetical protein [Lachnospiraceae bacterium]